jgi:hypothetical protein
MALLAGELSESDARAVRVHMEQCAGCSRRAAPFRQISKDLRKWGVGEPTSSLETNVLGVTKGENPASANSLSGNPAHQWPFSIPARWGLAAIGCAILISAGITLSFYSGRAQKEVSASSVGGRLPQHFRIGARDRVVLRGVRPHFRDLARDPWAADTFCVAALPKSISDGIARWPAGPNSEISQNIGSLSRTLAKFF